MSQPVFEISNVCSAFDRQTIGTKVVVRDAFRSHLELALAEHDVRKDRVPGQHYIVLPQLTGFVSAGVGRRTSDPDDYVLREHRGRVNAYLRRHLAAEVTSVAVVVYTREAYRDDPDVQADPAEVNRIIGSSASHVIVAVLASAGPNPPLTPFRLVANLAGGNKEALAWTADEIRTKAAEIVAYADDWDVVAD